MKIKQGAARKAGGKPWECQCPGSQVKKVFLKERCDQQCQMLLRHRINDIWQPKINKFGKCLQITSYPKGRCDGGLSGGPGGSCFPRGARDREGLSETARGGPLSQQPLLLSWICLLFLQCSGSHFAKAGSIWDVRGYASPLQVSRQMGGRKNEAPGP